MFDRLSPLAAVTTISVAVASMAATQDAMGAEGLYARLGAGLVSVNDADAEGHASELYAPPLDATAKTARGLAVSGAVGYGLGEGLRIEGELGYRKNDLEEMTVREPGSLVAILPPGAPPAALKGTQQLDGEISAVTLTANLYYDFDTGTVWRPYAVGGLGFSRISASAKSKATGTTLVDDKDTVFAYQIGTGIGYRLNRQSDRSAVVSLDYRYFGTADSTFAGATTGTKFDAELSGHYVGVSVMIGF